MLRFNRFQRLLVITVVLSLLFYGGFHTTMAAQNGKLVADLGFRPEVNGFPFENYGPGFTNLTANEMVRMFGDKVCASKANGKCILTPPAEQWMNQTNDAMNGGHCFGFSVLSLRLYQDKSLASSLGADTVTSLKIDGNDKLQRELAYSWTYQKFDAIRAGTLVGTPNGVLKALIQFLDPQTKTPELYTIGFFKVDGGGGHAVTPFAVEDRGNGLFAVLIYDNNFPRTTREILFDSNANKWTYTASTNPNEPESQYWGDAETKNLFLFPTTPGYQQQTCPFCEAASQSSVPRVDGLARQASAQSYNEIYLDGSMDVHAHLLITDAQGRRTGYAGNKLVKEIPGVEVEENFSADLFKDSEEPVYHVPTGMQFALTIDGSSLQKQDLTNVILIGPGYDLGVFDIKLDPGQKDTLTLSPDGKSLSYKPSGNEAPDIVLGLEHTGADYSFLVKGVEIDSGGTVNVTLEQDKGQLAVSTSGGKTPATFGIVMDRIDDQGEQTFSHDDGVTLSVGDTAYLDFGKWSGNGGDLTIDIDRGSDGTIDESIPLTDVN